MPEKKPAERPVKTRALRYIGNGAWVAGIPARDLSEDEVTARGIDADALLKARPDLYEAARPSAADAKSAETDKE